MDALQLSPPLPPNDPGLPLSHSQSSDSTARASVSTARSSQSTSRSKTSAENIHLRGSHESKPRLSKDQQDTLEREFSIQPKPSTATKKGFADHLGVSVEKVNNWFQNRRAKVKQDAKKQQQHIWDLTSQNPDVAGHPLANDSYINQAFFQTMDPSQVPHLMASTGPHMAAHYGPLSSEMHSRFDGPDFNVHPIIPEEPSYGEEPAVLNFFGLDASHGYQQHVDLNSVSAVSKQFNPDNDGMDPRVRAQHFMDSYYSNNQHTATAQPRDDNGNSHINHQLSAEMASSLQPHMFDSRRPSSSMPSNDSGLGDPTPDTTTSWSMVDHPSSLHMAMDSMPNGLQQQQQQQQQHWSEMSAHGGPVYSMDSRFTYQDDTPMLQPVLRSRHNLMEESASTTYNPVNMHGQHFPDQLPDFKAPLRCDSGTSMTGSTSMTEEMNNVDIQPRPHLGQQLRSSQSSSALATRRQRRPAALATQALRSNSYGNLAAAAEGPEASLRRIKSSTGVLNGRISKSGTSSAQRSPYAMAFAEHITSSPRLPKAPQHSTGPGGEPHAVPARVPVTPKSPGIRASHLHNPSNGTLRTEGESENAESIWSRMPDTAGTTNTSIYSHLPQTADTVKSYASPPHTPMDPSQMANMAIHNRPVSESSAFPPFPASAWGQAFQMPDHNWNEQPRQDMSMPPPIYRPPATGAGDDNMYMAHPPQRRQSVPILEGTSSSTPMVHASPNLPSGHSRQQQYQQYQQYPPPPPQPQPQQQQQQQQQQHQHQPNFQQSYPPQFAYQVHPYPSVPQQQQQRQEHEQQQQSRHLGGGSPQPSVPTTPQKSGTEIQISQFVPREPVDESALPPKSMSSQLPKDFTFHNQCPKDFSSPESLA